MTPDERSRVLLELERIETTLSQVSTWLDREGAERAAILCENAWRDVLGAELLIDRDAGRVLGLVNHGRALAPARADGRANGNPGNSTRPV